MIGHHFRGLLSLGQRFARVAQEDETGRALAARDVVRRIACEQLGVFLVAVPIVAS